jgi:hypothetical protein
VDVEGKKTFASLISIEGGGCSSPKAAKRDIKDVATRKKNRTRRPGKFKRHWDDDRATGFNRARQGGGVIYKTKASSYVPVGNRRIGA